MIPVVKPYLPNREKLDKLIDGIYERQWLTNNGVLVQELTQRLESRLGVENLLLVANGTLALQVAYRALGIAESDSETPVEAVTTPFTFIATASSLKWEGVQPVFADIDPDTWCLNPEEIEPAITSRTKAIVPVHVFGNVCDIEMIDKIAKAHNLSVVYDASHAFGVNYKGKSVLNYGDAATLSFHATKLFHTIEGGAIVFKRKEDLERAKRIINFGIDAPDSISELGINAKMNEFQAAMGLCVLDELDANLKSRERVGEYYNKKLRAAVQMQVWNNSASRNYAYAPIVLGSEEEVLLVQEALARKDIYTRRYFYPSLSGLSMFGCKKELPISETISRRVICIPIYSHLDISDQERIVDLILCELCGR